MKIFYTLSLLLFLVACSRMSGESYISCTEITEGLAGNNIGQTVITVQGYDEEILIWTVNTTMTRTEFEQEFFQDIYLSDEEIHELFEIYNQEEIYGITSYISELTNNHVVITMIYDYSIISDVDLNHIWGVDDFEGTVTLSTAIAGLEDQGAFCEITQQEVEID